MKRLLIYCLTMFFCLVFSGCYLDDFTASEQDKLLDDGIKIFMMMIVKIPKRPKKQTDRKRIVVVQPATGLAMMYVITA